MSWCGFVVFFCKQKTAYEMRISDWSSDVCSSDLEFLQPRQMVEDRRGRRDRIAAKEHLDVGELRARDQPEGDRFRAGDGAIEPRLDRREIGRASCRERVCQ